MKLRLIRKSLVWCQTFSKWWCQDIDPSLSGPKVSVVPWWARGNGSMAVGRVSSLTHSMEHSASTQVRRQQSSVLWGRRKPAYSLSSLLYKSSWNFLLEFSRIIPAIKAGNERLNFPAMDAQLWSELEDGRSLRSYECLILPLLPKTVSLLGTGNVLWSWSPTWEQSMRHLRCGCHYFIILLGSMPAPFTRFFPQLRDESLSSCYRLRLQFAKRNQTHFASGGLLEPQEPPPRNGHPVG